jgi:GT2 family glycosyltransferase
MADLSVVIVSWNVRDLLRQCLSTLAKADPLSLDIIVVDNASADGSVEMLQAEFPTVQLVANPDNRGFPTANNQGIALARGRYVLLLNSDTEVLGDALATMVAFADAHPDVGVVGPQLLNTDGSVQSSRRRLPTLATGFFESTWLQPYAPRQLLERYYVLDQPDDATLDVDWVKGAALMARGRLSAHGKDHAPRGKEQRAGPASTAHPFPDQQGALLSQVLRASRGAGLAAVPPDQLHMADGDGGG